jgi:phosphohistidine phosphatase
MAVRDTGISQGGFAVKTLVIIRHAKSDWSKPNLADFDRPLKRRGEKAAVQTADKLKLMGIQPQLMVTSPARRARDTAERIADEFGLPSSQLVVSASLYQAEVSDYFNALLAVSEQVSCVFIVGHNPEISSFVSLLGQQEIYMHTGSAVIFDIAQEWSKLHRAEQFLIINP